MPQNRPNNKILEELTGGKQSVLVGTERLVSDHMWNSKITIDNFSSWVT